MTFSEQNSQPHRPGAVSRWLTLSLLALTVTLSGTIGAAEEAEQPAAETQESAASAEDTNQDEAAEQPAESSDQEAAEADEDAAAKQEESPADDSSQEAQEDESMQSSEESASAAADSADEAAPAVEEERPVEVDPPKEPVTPPEEQPEQTEDDPKKEKCIIGATATVVEKQSGLKFRARVDSGAKSCSLHVEEIRIQDESTKEDIAERMTENIGKVISFKVKNGDGKTHILKRKIAGYVIIKTSNAKEDGKRRYKVPLTFKWKNMEKEVLVTLNNRNHMEYPLLLGRNFLRGDFLVDVELNSDD